MLILAPNGKVTSQALMDVFQQQLDLNGCAYLPMSFRRVQLPAAKAQAFEQGDDVDTLFDQGAKTGPNGVNEETRSVSGVANQLEISRSNIKIHIDGMDLSHYNQQNPVVLAGHRQISAELYPGAIGTIEKVTKAQGSTQLRYKGMRFDKDPLSEAWYQKVLSGTVRMTSIGFMPLDYSVQKEEVGTGKNKREAYYIDIPQSELVEISVLPVGANRGAMIGQGGLAQRLEAANQRHADLLAAVELALRTGQSAESEKARSQLMNAISQFKGRTS